MERKLKNYKDHSFCILGSGNVASHLAPALFEAGFKISQIFSRNNQTGKELADSVHSTFISDITLIDKEADFYLFLLPNDAIDEVVGQWPADVNRDAIFLHSSGSYLTEKFNSISDNYGVFYPLQTFKKGIPTDIGQTPFLIDSNKDEHFEILEELTKELSSYVYRLNDEERHKLHLSAVFINNFTNAIFSAAYSYLESEKVSREALTLIVKKTFDNLLSKHPDDIQTGPAIRGEGPLINSHLELLEQYPDHQEIYKSLTAYITKHFTDNEDS